MSPARKYSTRLSSANKPIDTQNNFRNKHTFWHILCFPWVRAQLHLSLIHGILLTAFRLSHPLPWPPNTFLSQRIFEHHPVYIHAMVLPTSAYGLPYKHLQLISSKHWTTCVSQQTTCSHPVHPRLPSALNTLQMSFKHAKADASNFMCVLRPECLTLTAPSHVKIQLINAVGLPRGKMRCIPWVSTSRRDRPQLGRHNLTGTWSVQEKNTRASQ